MTHHNNSGTPLYHEELNIDQEIIRVQEILNGFKQPVPVNFVELESKNYMCSTHG